MRFSFATAGQISFGAGCLREAGPLAAGMGSRALVVSGQGSAARERLLDLLVKHQVQSEVFTVSGEPSVETVQSAVRVGRAYGCDLVIALGGGSVIDTAKAAAAMLANPGALLDYLEVVGQGKQITNRPLPVIAIPTTAGTGSEVTRNAVLAVPEAQMKVSLRSPLMLPQAALVDPELTYSLPPDVTASTGMDALAQVIEPYVSSRANSLCDLYCRAGIESAGRSLLRAYRDGSDPGAREDMAFASLMGGLALANAGLGAVHGFASPLGGMYDAPHGAVCAALLPAVVLVNTEALAAREPGSPALARYMEIAQMVTGNPGASSADLAAWLDQLRQELHIPPLSRYGVQPAHVDALVEKGAAASSMKANPIELTPAELRRIIERSL